MNEQTPNIEIVEAVSTGSRDSVSSTELSPNTKKVRQNKKIQKQLEGKNIGHWSDQEKRLYYEVISQYKSLFARKELRRSDKVFKVMSQRIPTRGADQCRSHHQKMEKKFGSFALILEGMRAEYGNNQYYPGEEAVEGINKMKDSWSSGMLGEQLLDSGLEYGSFGSGSSHDDDLEFFGEYGPIVMEMEDAMNECGEYQNS